MKIKKIAFILSMSLCVLCSTVRVQATSLDDVISESQEEQQVIETIPTVPESVEQTEEISEAKITETEQQNNENEFLAQIKSATDLSEQTELSKKVNSATNTLAGFIVQVLSYFITAFLVVRVVLDLCYITIPFTRSMLSNGYAGSVNMSQGNPMSAAQQGGFGMNGMQGNMNGMAPMNMQMQGQPGVSPASGKTQGISTAALNAVASEQTVGANGKSNNALKEYSKDMVVLLVATVILLTLAITGALTDLGFLIGQVLTNSIQGIGNMI